MPNIDTAANDAALGQECIDLAWEIVGGADRPSAHEVAKKIRRLVDKYAHYTPTTDVAFTKDLRDLLSIAADDDMPEDIGIPGRISVCAGAWFKETDHRWRFWRHRYSEATP